MRNMFFWDPLPSILFFRTFSFCLKTEILTLFAFGFDSVRIEREKTIDGDTDTIDADTVDTDTTGKNL